MKRKIVSFYALFLIFAVVLSCSSCATPKADRRQFFAMGTAISVSAYGGSVPSGMSQLALNVEKELSYKLENAVIARANAGETVAVSKDLYELLLLCQELTEKTNGAFDVTVKPISELWGFDLAPSAPPSDTAIDAALTAVGWDDRISLSASSLYLGGAQMDLGAVGKGYACDRLVAQLRESGLCGIVSVGGSIGTVSGPQKDRFTVGVRDPFSENQNDLIASITWKDGFLSTSGTYEKHFTHEGESYHHILNANTGRPERSGIVSLTVVASSGALSDALSTAAFLLGVEEGMALCRFYGAEAFYVLENGSVLATEGLRGAVSYFGNGEVAFR